MDNKPKGTRTVSIMGLEAGFGGAKPNAYAIEQEAKRHEARIASGEYSPPPDRNKTAILAAMEECARVCDEVGAAFDKEWRAGLKADQHLQGLGDGASDCADAIRAKIQQMKEKP